MAALILIVDDDPIQRRLLEAMARRFGYDVETVDSGEGALARLQSPDRPPVSLAIRYVYCQPRLEFTYC